MTRYLRPVAHKALPVLGGAAAFLLAFTAVAHAASAAEPANGSLLDLLQPVLDAFRSGNHLLAGASALVVAVALARRYLASPKAKWVATEAGSLGLTLVGSFGATLTAQLTAGAVPSFATVETALKIAFAASGGYAALKALVVTPYVENLADKGPRWLHAPLKVVLWIFQHVPVQAPTAPAASPESSAEPTAQQEAARLLDLYGKSTPVFRTQVEASLKPAASPEPPAAAK